jgi:hypothetical protein
LGRSSFGFLLGKIFGSVASILRKKVGAGWASVKGRCAARGWFRWARQGEDAIGLWAAAEPSGRGKKKKEGWATWLHAGKLERLGRPDEKKKKIRQKADWAEPDGYRKIDAKQILLKESPFYFLNSFPI